MNKIERPLASWTGSPTPINLHRQPAQRERSAECGQPIVAQNVTPIAKSIPNAALTSAKKTRKRGLVLTDQGWQKLEAAKTQLEFAENYGEHFTFDALSERSELDPRTVARILHCSEGVDKSSLKQFFRAFNLPLEKTDYTAPVPSEVRTKSTNNVHLQQNLAAHTIESSDRTTDLMQLGQKIVDDCCRLIVLLGLEGVGQTTLSVTWESPALPQLELSIRPVIPHGSNWECRHQTE